jgi:hypothetical protein
MSKLIKAAALAASVAFAGTAQAAVYNLSYTSGGTSFIGTVTTTNTADANGFYTVTGLSGTRGGVAVTLLAPGAFPTNGFPNDNLFKPTGAFFSDNGISYSAGSTYYNIYAGALECRSAALTSCTAGANNAVTGLTVSLASAAVPEPATWAMMMLGFGAMGAALRSRRQARVAFA